MLLSFFLDKDDVIINELNKNCINCENHILELCNFSWDIGKIVAINTPNISMNNLIKKANITIVKKKSLLTIDRVIFSNYNKINNSITIYEDTIKKHFIPYMPSNYSLNSYNLFLKHEFFHFLQCNNFYNLRPYKLNFLNEIAAYSFTNNWGILH